MKTIQSMVVYSSNVSTWVAEDQEFHLCPSNICCQFSSCKLRLDEIVSGEKYIFLSACLSVSLFTTDTCLQLK